jgi:hypothetical protein
MASRPQEVSVRRVIACFAPGAAAGPDAIARLARDMQAELLGLFIQDEALLRFAALPFAAEVGFPSATRRPLDPAALERALRAQAASLERAIASVLDPAALAWSFRVARASPADAVEAALAEGYAPALLIPPRGSLRAERSVVRRAQLGPEVLRELLAAARPVLVLP